MGEKRSRAHSPPGNSAGSKEKFESSEILSAGETTNSTAAIGVTYHTLRTVNYWLIESIAMSSDEIVWQVINQQFCSFKLK
jgi:hypothetical protein